MNQKNEKKNFFGFVPPWAMVLKGDREVLGFYIAALCSVECARFHIYTSKKVSFLTDELKYFLSPYTLCDWAIGKIPQEVFVGREDSARDSLVRWARFMLEINSVFRQVGILNPVGFAIDQKLIEVHPSGYGFKANVKNVNKILSLDL